MIDVAEVTIVRAGGELFLVNTDHPVVLLAPPPAPNSINRFTLAVLLTESTTDAFGRPRDDRYLGLYEFNDATGALRPFTPAEVPPVPATPLRARVLVAQHRAEVPPLTFEQLFGPLGDAQALAAGLVTPEDAEARIVSMSEPIEEPVSTAAG